MAHFARINENNIVTHVHVLNNAILDDDGEFPGSEPSGQGFQSDLGFDGVWLQCSYNGNFRGNYPGVGFSYDPVLDAFIAPQPFPSWVLDEETCQWVPPVAYPEDGGEYSWDEGAGDWVEIPGA